MRRVMWRTDDEDLYQRVFEAAHDARVSMNAWITDRLRIATEPTPEFESANCPVVGCGFRFRAVDLRYLRHLVDRHLEESHLTSPDTSVEDKANARASLAHTTEGRDA